MGDDETGRKGDTASERQPYAAPEIRLILSHTETRAGRGRRRRDGWRPRGRNRYS